MAKEAGLHVVMVPYFAFGILNPFVHLSVALAKYGVRVSFISTPRNIQRIPKLPSDGSTLINLVAFPLPLVDDGRSLPEGAEAENDVSPDKYRHLRATYDLLRHPIKQFIINESPNWIIVDIFPHWAIDIADELGVPVCLFSVLSAASRALFVWPPPECYKKGDCPSPLPESLSTSPPGWLLRMGKGKISEQLVKIIEGCKGVAIRSCMEIEGDYLEVLEKIYRRKPFIPVGLLPPPVHHSQPDQQGREPHYYGDHEEWLKRFNWLDQQKPKSVVFVGFGSSCKLRKYQIHEIAYGLELSNLPFLWSLIIQPDDHQEESDILPPNFLERTAGRGRVCMGWAPQLEILANPAVGGSFFHAGWGSIIENLRYGCHRLIVLPMVYDQGLNARMLVDKGLAVQVEQNEDGSLSRDVIAKCLRKAMVTEEGDQIALKAAEATAVVNHPTLHQEHYMGGFVQFLKNGVATKKMGKRSSSVHHCTSEVLIGRTCSQTLS